MDDVTLFLITSKINYLGLHVKYFIFDTIYYCYLLDQFPYEKLRF